MYGEGVQNVLRCGQCNKPFDKDSTLKRHGYYCRSRRSGTTHARKPACFACKRRKASCDNRHPECSRCISKGVKCLYPPATINATESRIQNNSTSAKTSQDSVPVLSSDFRNDGSYQQNRSEELMTLDDGLIANPDILSIDTQDIDWMDPNFDFADLLNSQASDETEIFLSEQAQRTTSFPFLSILPAPSDAIRMLNHRPRIDAAAQRIATLILHVLKSYPRMMLHQNTLPPFIHPWMIKSNAENNEMESLTNCISLVRMISIGAHASRKLFWKNVSQECERLCEDYPRLSKWELVAAMQGLSIYLLVRLDEGETEYNNLDFLITRTVVVISKQLAVTELIHEPHLLYTNDPETIWQEWILEESKRRLCVVYQIVNMLVYFEPAALCDLHSEHLILAPLPARKSLWEAGDQCTWNTERETVCSSQTDFGLAVNGELVEVDGGRLGCNEVVMLEHSRLRATSTRESRNWENWCAGMDGFGGLVMLAAALVV